MPAKKYPKGHTPKKEKSKKGRYAVTHEDCRQAMLNPEAMDIRDDMCKKLVEIGELMCETIHEWDVKRLNKLKKIIYDTYNKLKVCYKPDSTTSAKDLIKKLEKDLKEE